MTLKAHEAVKWIEGRLGEIDDLEAGMRILNEAGKALVSPPNGHAWSWLEREGSLSLVGAQNYIALPDGFKSLIDTEDQASSSSNVLRIVQPGTFMEYVRGVGVGNTAGYVAAIFYVVGASGEPLPRLRVHPTPVTSQANFAQLWYRAGWTELVQSSSNVSIPDWTYSLYRELVVAFALGWSEPDEAPVLGAPASGYVSQVWGGAIAAQVLRHDDSLQVHMGLPSHTIVNRSDAPRGEKWGQTVLNS